MVKNIDYYMNLNYLHKIRDFSIEEGEVGYDLSIPMLGEMCVHAYGDTLDKAYKILQDEKKYFFERWIENGINIPEPDSEQKLA